MIFIVLKQRAATGSAYCAQPARHMGRNWHRFGIALSLIKEYKEFIAFVNYFHLSDSSLKCFRWCLAMEGPQCVSAQAGLQQAAQAPTRVRTTNMCFILV